jgi:hypothetical protein
MNDVITLNFLKQLYGAILISIMRLTDASHFEIYFLDSASTPIDHLIRNFCLSTNQQTYSVVEEQICKKLINLKNISYEDSIGQFNVIKLIYMCKTMLDAETFPRDWFDLLILRNNVILNAMYHVAERINRNHSENFSQLNKQIWFDYFECMVHLCTDRVIQLEKFNENKRKNVLNKFKDIRIKAAHEIKKMWYNLGNKKHHFIPNLVEPFMRVALIPITEIHNAIIPLFFDMINSEHLSKGNSVEFDNFCVPKAIITTLDKQTLGGYGDLKFRTSIEKILKERFNAHISLKNKIEFVKNVVDLIDLLTEYRQLRDESADGLKTFYLNEILSFYGQLKRYDIYVKYVEMLRKIHKSLNNPVCSAYTLKLHAELLYWTNEPVEPYLQHPSYPIQKTHRELKELLFLDLINDYTKGQAWEKALELSKILRGIYDSQYEFEKLNVFLRKQADLCENIIKKDRYECKYYLVGFYGRKFPYLLQNKRFVFRSEQLEQIMTFRQRVEGWFPKANRISHSNPLSDAEMNSDNQFIQIISVQPIYEPKEQFKGLNIPPRVLNYYHHNEVNKFKFTFRKETKLNEDDPTLWWLTEKVVIISNSLPDIINFYPVTEETTIDISPIQNAVNSVRERLEKLKQVYQKIERSHEVEEIDKSLIQGTIDPGVLGGLPKYKKFFAQTYLDSNPESIEMVNRLKNLIIETINWGESFLGLTLEYLPNDDLLNILKREQLPKLKMLFDMPVHPTMRKKLQPAFSLPLATSQSIDNSSISSSNTGTNQSTNAESTPKKTYSGRALLSYLVTGVSNSINYGGTHNNNTSSSSNVNNHNNSSDKLSNNNISHRNSVSSIKSTNSENENIIVMNSSSQSTNDLQNTKTKIYLDETVNPKRPLRPNRLQQQHQQNNQSSATSSPNNSNQNSRPISHLSGINADDFNSISNFLNIQSMNLDDGSEGSMMMIDQQGPPQNGQHQVPPPPPPKPPKFAKLKPNPNSSPVMIKFQQSNAHSSSENLDQQNESLNSSSNHGVKQSTTSLNSVQYRFMPAKTTASDSEINRV